MLLHTLAKPALALATNKIGQSPNQLENNIYTPETKTFDFNLEQIDSLTNSLYEAVCVCVRVRVRVCVCVGVREH